MVDICQATKQRGKYLSLVTDTEVNQIVPFLLRNEKKCARNPEQCRQLNSRYHPEFE